MPKTLPLELLRDLSQQCNDPVAIYKRSDTIFATVYNSNLPTFINQLSEEINTWSVKNFSHNAYKPTWTADSPAPILSYYASLLGIVEELGELAIASSPEKLIDSFADILIFLLDYTHRSGCLLGNAIRQVPEPLPTMNAFREEVKGKNPEALTTVWLCQLDLHVKRLCQTELKRCQGIRGMQKSSDYERTRNGLAVMIYHYTSLLCFSSGIHPLTLTSYVWQQVRQRDWTTNPSDSPSEGTSPCPVPPTET